MSGDKKSDDTSQANGYYAKVTFHTGYNHLLNPDDLLQFALNLVGKVYEREIEQFKAMHEGKPGSETYLPLLLTGSANYAKTIEETTVIPDYDIDPNHSMGIKIHTNGTGNSFDVFILKPNEDLAKRVKKLALEFPGIAPERQQINV